MTNATDLKHVRRAVELARVALEAGDAPFGSVLVSGEGKVLADDRNSTSGGDATRHPEFELARWAATHMTPAERARATVYTSGEHCPMCAAAHGLVGLGRIVYAVSSRQFLDWLAALGISDDFAVRQLPIAEVAPKVKVEGPVPEVEDEVRELYRRRYAVPRA
jgi:tRNA(Arg) A34 adenosine deaminase TadA